MKKAAYIGPFYYYKGKIIISENFLRRINPTTMAVESGLSIGSPLEHRDMWDSFMVVKYPELKKEYDDDHKALPRGRVDYSKSGNKLSFFVTLDKCIVNQEDKIKRIFNLSPVSFHYGTMNYKCKRCRFI